jgi:hypothetical protein
MLRWVFCVKGMSYFGDIGIYPSCAKYFGAEMLFSWEIDEK